MRSTTRPKLAIALSSLFRSSQPLVPQTTALYQQVQPGQSRKFTNPPDARLVEAVRDLAAGMLRVKRLAHGFDECAAISREAPIFYALMRVHSEEKWKKGMKWEVAQQQLLKELRDIVEADARKQRPVWTRQEHEFCRLWTRRRC